MKIEIENVNPENKQIDELEEDYRYEVCGIKNKNKQSCCYVRRVKKERNSGVLIICAKGTPDGEKHREEIDKWITKYPDGTIKIKNALGKEVTMVIFAGDNCPGRAHEFAHLFKKWAN